MQFSKWITLGFGALCLVAVAAVLKAQHLYYMAAILLTLPGVSCLLGWYALRGLEFSRELPPSAWEGEEGSVRYRVRNRSRVARFFLTIQEPLPAWIVTKHPEPPLFNVAGNAETQVAQQVTYTKRGVYSAPAFDVTAMDPLGVFAFSKHIPCEGELIVYPAPSALASIPLTGNERFGWNEFLAVALRGSSVEPDGVRPYIAGDSLRRIHWRQTARTGKLSVIEFEDPQAVNLVIVLDAQRGTEVGKGKETTLEYAVHFAASVAHEAIRQGAAVRFVTQPEAISTGELDAMVYADLPTSRGQLHFFTILNALARIQADAPEPIGAVIDRAVGPVPPGTTLLVLTSKLDKTLLTALLPYTAAGIHAGVIYIDPETFRMGGPAAAKGTADEAIAELAGVHVQTFILNRNPEGEMQPEAMVPMNAAAAAALA